MPHFGEVWSFFCARKQIIAQEEKHMAAYNAEFAEIGAKIVARREELGMKASELAIQAGVCASTLSQIESGQRAAKLETLIAIAEALKVSLDYFQPDKLNQYTALPKGLAALLPKLKEKSPAEQQMLIRMFSAMIDSM